MLDVALASLLPRILQMGTLEMIVIAFGMAMDAMTVSLAAATTGRLRTLDCQLRLSFHLGFFQFLMPIIGWYAGTTIAFLIAPIDHWIAAGLLGFIALRMIRSGFHPEPEHTMDPSRGWELMILSIATSVDALAIGLSMALIGIDIWKLTLLIGVITFGVAFSAARFGNSISAHFGQRIPILGGAVLIIIALRILYSHLYA